MSIQIKFSRLAIISLGLAMALTVRAEETPEYMRAISTRAERIIEPLNIENGEKRTRVRNLIIDQYRWLNKAHNDRDASIEEAKVEASSPELAQEKVNALKATSDDKIKERHAVYLKQLSEELSPAQVDRVKDGMTYGVVQITYEAYQKMLPGLTAEQKRYIQAQLEEAREIAMDAGSSKEKHWWFGKYKGRINNFLSKEGYDLKTASKRVEGENSK